MIRVKEIPHCFYKALVDMVDHDGIEHAGYLAFLAILCIFPFIVFMFATVGFIGQSEIGVRFVNIIINNQIFPENIIIALKPRIDEIMSGPPQGLLTIAVIGAIWTASSAVEGLRTILNRAYRVSTPPAYIWRRLLSIGQFLILTAIVILVTFLFIIGPSIWNNISNIAYVKDMVMFINFDFSVLTSFILFRYFITSIILFFVVVIIYYTLPNIKQRWISVFPGAILTVALWFLAGYLFSLYLKEFDQVNIIYGSLGGLIAALLFFYINAMILILGAEFNYMIEKAQGHKIKEKEKV